MTLRPLAVTILLTLSLVFVHVAGASDAASAGIPIMLDLLGNPVQYVIVTDDALIAAFQPLADWKTQSGVPAVVQGLLSIRAQYPAAADDPERIRLFIRNAYRHWGTRWVLLGGDVGVVAARHAYTTFFGGASLATDLYYQCLDGNWDLNGNGLYGEGYFSSAAPGDSADLVPEVYIGRAPVSTVAEVQRFVSKTIQYEKTPAPDYEHLVLCPAEVLFPQDWSGGPISLDGAEVVEPLLPHFDLHPELHIARLYENALDPRWRPGAFPESRAAVLDSLTRGYNLVVAVGHGNASSISVGDAAILECDVLALGNGPRLSNLYCVGQSVNDIDSTAIGETALLAPGGAVTCIGSSAVDFPTATRGYLNEYIRLVMQGGVTAVGEAHARLKLPFIPFSSYDGVQRWTQMTNLLLGDPELRLWIGAPCILTVLHPAEIAFGDTEFTVRVIKAGAPFPGARVAAYFPGRALSIVTTDGAGLARVPFMADQSGDFTLTVTAPNCRPDPSVIHVTESPTPAQVSLLSAESDPGEVRLLWACADCSASRATVFRRTPETTATAIAAVSADGSGQIPYVDRDLTPGSRLGYRLELRGGGTEILTDELWVDVPVLPPLALVEIHPNPARGAFAVRFSLPSNHPARLELLDLAGRRVLAREVGALGAGLHDLTLASDRVLPGGLYFLRLSQAGLSRVRRLAVAR